MPLGTDAILGLEMDRPELTASPRNRLMLAVLEEALVTFQRGLNSARAEQRPLDGDLPEDPPYPQLGPHSGCRFSGAAPQRRRHLPIHSGDYDEH